MFSSYSNFVDDVIIDDVIIDASLVLNNYDTIFIEFGIIFQNNFEGDLEYYTL